MRLETFASALFAFALFVASLVNVLQGHDIRDLRERVSQLEAATPSESRESRR